MPLKQLSMNQWREIASPLFLATLPILPNEFSSQYQITFEEIEDDGLGIAQVAIVEIATTLYLLIAHPQGPQKTHYLTVAVRSYEANGEQALEKLLSALEINVKDLLWRNDQLGEAQWILYRMDDYGNEAEMFRFHSQSNAEWVRKKYEDKGHKQIYFVRDQNDPQ